MMFATALDSAPAYVESVAAAGFGDVARRFERVAAGDLRAAVQAVPDEMADAMALAGSVEHVRGEDRRIPLGRAHRRHAEPVATRRLVPPLRGPLSGRRRAAAVRLPGFIGVLDTTLDLLGT